MPIVKQILSYCIWVLIAFISAFAYTRLILGPKPDESANFFMFIYSLIYNFGFIRIGLIIGSIISILYILLDVFYLKKRLIKTKYATLIRLLILMGITVVLGLIHYILEKVLDVI
jgi:hypothetical protein